MRSLQWYKRGAAYVLKVKSCEEWAQLFTAVSGLYSDAYAICVKSEEWI